MGRGVCDVYAAGMLVSQKVYPVRSNGAPIRFGGLGI